MNRITTWLGIAIGWMVDAEAWDRVSAILRRASIVGALVAAGAILFYRMQFSPHPYERVIVTTLLMTVLPFAAFSIIRRIGDGEFFYGLWLSLVSFGVVAALTAAIIAVSIPTEFQQWVSKMVSQQPAPAGRYPSKGY